MTLPAHYYTSEEIFAQELERIFYNRWVFVGRQEEIPHPGDYIVRTVGTEQLILLRDRQGAVRSFYNLCRHRGTQLCMESSGHFAGTIRCPYHAWSFGLDGELLSAPFMQAIEGFRREDFPLQAVETAVWEGCLFVNLASQPQPLPVAFAPLLDRFTAWNLPQLHSAHQIEYILHTNWKLIAQNYSECYHCPVVHPELHKMSVSSSSTNDLFRGPFLGGPMSIDPPYTSLNLTGDRTTPPLGTVVNEDLQRAYYYFIFPNLLLSLQPDFVMVHRLEPQSPSTTRVLCDWLFAPETIAQPGFDPTAIAHFWDMVNRQDWQICESMQQGIQSRAYTPGFYSGQESLLAEIDHEVLKALGKDEA